MDSYKIDDIKNKRAHSKVTVANSKVSQLLKQKKHTSPPQTSKQQSLAKILKNDNKTRDEAPAKKRRVRTGMIVFLFP